jgi:DNA primase
MEHIADLLRQKNISFNISGPDFLVKCLNPEHEDSNPSMRIDKTTGIYNCFACGFKGNIFKYFGILTNNTSLRVAKLKEKLRMLQIDTEGIPLPEGATPISSEFRGISKKTLKKFGAFYTDAVTELQDRIIFPITDLSGKTVVYVARHSLSSGNPRYINYPRGVKIPVFPSILETSVKSIVLVEGIFDFLNVYDKGLHNAVCTFGTNTLMSDTKMKLQPFKAQGITKVFIMFDGDEAGREAAYKLKPQIEEMELVVEIIKLEDDSDPGELSLEYVTSLKEYIYAENSNH